MRTQRQRKRKLDEVVGDYSMVAGVRYAAPGNIRSDMFVKGKRRNVLRDEEEEAQPVDARFLVTRDDDKVLIAVDPHDSFEMKLPSEILPASKDPEAEALAAVWQKTKLFADRAVQVAQHTTELGDSYVIYRIMGSFDKKPPQGYAWADIEDLLASNDAEFYKKIFKRLGM